MAMDWFNLLTGETRGRLLGLLRQSERSIPDLAEALGISDTAVRNHVAALQRDGLVEPADVERETGGKPARRYRLVAAAEELYPKAYAFVLVELLRTLEAREGREAVVALLREVGGRAAPASASGDEALGSRVASAAAVLRELGGEVEVERAGDGWCIRGHGCPLSAAVREYADVCELAASLVEQVTGRPVTGCCQHGERPKCGFLVAGGAASHAPAPVEPPLR